MKDLDYGNIIWFSFLHLVPFSLLFIATSAIDWIVCAVLYFSRIFFIGAGYHRYFSHKTFKTSRFFQFVLAFGTQTAMQGGVIQWSADHRRHHMESDKEKDIHSPKQKGIFYAHMGWLLKKMDGNQRGTLALDLERYPELRFLDKHDKIPGLTVAAICFLVGGWSMLIVGFLISTLLVYHGTWMINSYSHLIGFRRYETTDTSRNNLLTGLLTLGEGWHNNHHHYQASARQGFFWWEIDVTYYILKFLSLFRIVWDIREVPKNIKMQFAQKAPQ